MKRAVVFVVMGGLSLAGAAVLGCFSHNPASAAELNGFAINTQDKDKAVTITLFTDHRVPYATEHQGKQFTIVLPNTQISPEQLSNGLPVVVDNKNHFIGRAVPGDDGKVRIILPNLPASDYAISIQQRHAVPKNTGDSTAKPRSASNMAPGNSFEQVVANIPKAHSSKQIASKNTIPDNGALRLSSGTHRIIERGPNTRNMIWNPYATKPPRPATAAAHEEPSINKTTSEATEPIHLSHISPAQAVNFPLPAQPLPQARLTAPAHDPLWYLHSLPPTDPNAVSSADFKTLAAQDTQLQAAAKAAAAKAQTKQANVAPAQPSYARGLLKELKASFRSIPKWLLITLAIFMGGIGVFTLFGGLVLLKILFLQARTQTFTQPMSNLNSQQPVDASTANNQASSEKSPYATRPGTGRTLCDFEDKSSVSALDYLKGSPDSVAAAVHNATLLKFPTSRKSRNSFKKHVTPAKADSFPYRVSPS